MSGILYEFVRSANDGTRQEIATELIAGIREGSDDARIHYWTLVSNVLSVELGGLSHDIPQSRREAGEFSPEGSAGLVALEERSRQFIEAIAAAQPRDEAGRPVQVRSVIDAGCGSSAFLAVGAAVLHPTAEVKALEVNPIAAECARRVVGYLGLRDRISVEQGDALAVRFTHADLGVSETFGPAFAEPGMEIIHRLAQKTRLVVPAIGKLFVRDLPAQQREADNEPWQDRPAMFDLRSRHEYVGGHVRISGDGPRRINVFSGLYRADGTPILDDPQSNNDITHPVTIGTIPNAPRGSIFAFQYRPGGYVGSSPVEIYRVA